MVLWIASVNDIACAWLVQAMARRIALQRGVKTRMEHLPEVLDGAYQSPII
jgi:hypothetical protein